MRHRGATAILLFVAATLSGCSSDRPVFPPAPSGTLRIISSLPARGPAAGQTRAISDAIGVAINDHKGKSRSATIDYLALDDASDETGDWSRDKELANATLAADDPSVIAYVGPFNTGAAEISLPVTNRAGFLQASPSTTWPGLTLSGWDAGEPDRYFPTGSRTFFRLMPPDSIQAQAAVQWVAKLGYHSVSVMTDGSSYSEGMGRTFSLKARATRLTLSTSLDASAMAHEDFARELGGAQAIFYAPSSVENAVLAARRLDRSALPVFTTDTALDPRFITEAGSAGRNWFILSNSAQPDRAGGFAPMLGSNGSERRFTSQFAANAYGVTDLILDGVDSGSVRDRTTLLSFVRSRKNSMGLLFTNTGDLASWVVSGYRVGPDGFALDSTFVSSP